MSGAMAFLNFRSIAPDDSPMSRTGNQQRGRKANRPPGRPTPARQQGTLRLVQLTDTHLYSDADGRLLGQNTRQTLELVLELISATYWPVDRVLLTGDLVQDESREGYRYLEQRLARLGTPCNGLPGNHDIFGLMTEAFASGTISVAPNIRCGTWNIIFLDSTVPGTEGGHLSAVQLQRLEAGLAANPKAHTIVCLHHQPVPVGSAWMDTMALDNPKDFFSVIDRSTQVRGILWGHVHQSFSGRRNGVALLGTPSTCIQFAPGSEHFAIDSLTPGFRWLELNPDGSITTGIERIAAYPDPIDQTTRGY